MTAVFHSRVVQVRLLQSVALPGAILIGLASASPASAAAPIRSVYYSYDAMGRQLAAKLDSASGADGVVNVYNGFGELTSSTLSMGTFSKALTSAYDGAGRRTLLTHPDGQAFTYAYDPADRLTGVYEGNGTTTPLDTFTWNNDGTLGSRSEGAGTSAVSYSWDGIGRLTGQSDTFATTTDNVSWTFTINSASQIASEARTESSNRYAYGGVVTVNRAYAVNGLNQYTTAGPATFTYDPNGNLTADGANTFTYDIENRLVTAVNGSTTVNLTYDPLGRLFQVDKGTSATTTRFVYDGDALVDEFDGSGTLINRYVHGSNTAADDPLVWYVGSGLSARKWLHADHLGSIIAATGSSGTASINSYDEYGVPQTDAATHTINLNTGRFQYTGQAWIGELGMYYYKARIYSPKLGRFLQTDPIGYDDQINLYAYVGNDPVNATDPDGQFGLVGAAIGIGIEIALEMGVEGKSFDDVDVGKVAISAVAGGTGLGAIKQGIRAYRAIQAARAASRTANRAQAKAQERAQTGSKREARQAKYHADRRSETAQRETDKAAKAVTGAVGAVAGAAVAKESVPTVTVGDVKREVGSAVEKIKKEFF